MQLPSDPRDPATQERSRSKVGFWPVGRIVETIQQNFAKGKLDGRTSGLSVSALHEPRHERAFSDQGLALPQTGGMLRVLSGTQPGRPPGMLVDDLRR